ncbi:MAG: aminotransferase class I/II-fold pyridoxal phosphate-dependent enzyme [Parachlamydiaceae bacterium]|nr:MAG: aminotransferase class I/II-fold pyridoxal phosphate-dependent enzyme [Parachlamydiaceae bacterium]
MPTLPLVQCFLIVDEAHATGVWGPGGRGLIEDNQLESQVLARIITFGKALGAQGAIVLGDALLKNCSSILRVLLFTRLRLLFLCWLRLNAAMIFPNHGKRTSGN